MVKLEVLGTELEKAGFEDCISAHPTICNKALTAWVMNRSYKAATSGIGFCDVLGVQSSMSIEGLPEDASMNLSFLCMLVISAAQLL